MKRLVIAALFVALTVTYFRFVIWSPADALLTNHLATDLHGHFVHIWERLGLLKDGFMPMGDYWVQRGGGFPAALNDQITKPQELLLMITYIAVGGFTVALKILVPFFYLATLATAYWYGTILVRRRDASVVLAVAYAFSVYGVNQLEHLGLVGVQPFILLSLIFLEKTLRGNRLRDMVLTSVFLFLVFASNLYPLYYTLLFVIFRVTFHLLTSPHRLEALKSVAKVGTLFSSASLPILLPKLFSMPSQQLIEALGQIQLAYAQPPTLYFLRNTPYTPYVTETYFMYLGLSVLVLVLIPMLTKQTRSALYIFHLLVATFFMLYAIGQYGPVDLSRWFHEHVPLAFFMQVPGRALVLGYLSLAVCAAIGFAILVERFRWKLLATPFVVLIIFADLTIGFEPTTMPECFQQNTVNRFIKEQPEDFRVVEIPSIHNQQAMTIIYTERDTLNSTLWAFGHFDPLQAFAEVYSDYTESGITAREAALYGVKYVVVNTDPQYFVRFERALKTVGGPGVSQIRRAEDGLSTSEDYKLVYHEGYTKVYENLEFRGLVFSDDANFLAWSRRGPNTLVIDYDSVMPTTIVVSQSYAEGWTATLDGNVKLPVSNFDSVQQIEVPAGSHGVLLHYQNYERWFIITAAFYTTLTVVVVWMWRRGITREPN